MHEARNAHNATATRVLMYRRSCTNDPQAGGTSLDRQNADLAAFADHLGASIVLDFVEVASGSAEHDGRRVEMARLLACVRTGDVVAVSRFDRLSRHGGVAFRKLRAILRKDARLISVAEGEVREEALPLWAPLAGMDRARRGRTKPRVTKAVEPHTA